MVRRAGQPHISWASAPLTRGNVRCERAEAIRFITQLSYIMFRLRPSSLIDRSDGGRWIGRVASLRHFVYVTSFRWRSFVSVSERINGTIRRIFRVSAGHPYADRDSPYTREPFAQRLFTDSSVTVRPGPRFAVASSGGGSSRVIHVIDGNAVASASAELTALRRVRLTTSEPSNSTSSVCWRG